MKCPNPWSRSADTPLEHAQQFRLRLQRQVTGFIEEPRPAVGLPEHLPVGKHYKRVRSWGLTRNWGMHRSAVGRGERKLVDLFHCKFAKDAQPSARVEDLYTVCGQAQRSVYWKGDVVGLIEHLHHREVGHVSKHGASRFERGDLSRLAEIARQVPYLTPKFRIFIVQPGLSKSKAEAYQLELLAVTELYLQETYGIELGVIASP